MKGSAKSRKAVSVGALVVLLILVFAGQTFGSGTPKFAYAANFSSNNISAYTIDATTGVLTPVSGSPFAEAPGPQEIAVDPSGKFICVTHFGCACISGWTINATTGSLTAIPGSSSRRY